ncbi:unnamed protein product, partial [Polarella glacialis]
MMQSAIGTPEQRRWSSSALVESGFADASDNNNSNNNNKTKNNNNNNNNYNNNSNFVNNEEPGNAASSRSLPSPAAPPSFGILACELVDEVLLPDRAAVERQLQ